MHAPSYHQDSVVPNDDIASQLQQHFETDGWHFDVHVEELNSKSFDAYAGEPDSRSLRVEETHAHEHWSAFDDDDWYGDSKDDDLADQDDDPADAPETKSPTKLPTKLPTKQPTRPTRNPKKSFGYKSRPKKTTKPPTKMKPPTKRPIKPSTKRPTKPSTKRPTKTTLQMHFSRNSYQKNQKEPDSNPCDAIDHVLRQEVIDYGTLFRKVMPDWSVHYCHVEFRDVDTGGTKKSCIRVLSYRRSEVHWLILSNMFTTDRKSVV